MRVQIGDSFGKLAANAHHDILRECAAKFDSKIAIFIFGKRCVSIQAEICCVVDCFGYLFVNLLELRIMTVISIDLQINFATILLQLSKQFCVVLQSLLLSLFHNLKLLPQFQHAFTNLFNNILEINLFILDHLIRLEVDSPLPFFFTNRRDHLYRNSSLLINAYHLALTTLLSVLEQILINFLNGLKKVELFVLPLGLFVEKQLIEGSVELRSEDYLKSFSILQVKISIKIIDLSTKVSQNCLLLLLYVCSRQGLLEVCRGLALPCHSLFTFAIDCDFQFLHLNYQIICRQYNLDYAYFNQSSFNRMMDIR